MADPHGTTRSLDDAIELGDEPGRWQRGLAVIAGIGLVAALGQAAMAEDGWRRFMLAYLVAFAFVLSLSLGAMFFVLLQHVCRAGWSVLVRRPIEAMAANMPVVALLFVPIALSVVLGGGEVFPWAQRGEPAASAAEVAPASQAQAEAEAAGAADRAELYPHQTLDDFTLKKRPYLNEPMFILRWIAFLAIWGGIGWWYWRQSTLQDGDGDAGRTARMEKWSGILLLVYGLTVTFAAFDLLMSLNPHWYSTIFGVYYFSGAAMAVVAAWILMLMLLQSRGYLATSVTVEHYHDLGKFLFGFVFFWGYIAFSQYMLLWYASLPEVLGWMQHRGLSTDPAHVEVFGSWAILALVLLVGHFLMPFAGLMSRHAKRVRGVLAVWAIWLLVMHYADMLWLVMPEFGPRLTLGLVEVGLAVAVGCVFLIGVVRRGARAALAPRRDPRLEESLGFENF